MGPSDETEIRLTRAFAAPLDEVFAAWTEPERLERWWTGVGGWVEAKAAVDLRPGGRYHLSMRDERGALHGIVGVYTEVRPPERLSFTWTWEKDPTVMRGSEGTFVVVDLRADSGGTELTLTHGGFSGKLVRGMHEEGWSALLGSLGGALSG